MSNGDLDLELWGYRANGIANVPSVKQLKGSKDRLNDCYGIASREINGKQGNIFTLNSIGDIIANVRYNLHRSSS